MKRWIWTVALLAGVSAPAKELAQLAQQVEPMVMCLEARAADGVRYGSGVQLREGFLATVWHQVREAVAIAVYTHDGLRSRAELVAYDPVHDLALLKIAPRPGQVVFTHRRPLMGEQVFAIGCPFGLGQTLKTGWVSQPRRHFDGVEMIQLAMAVEDGMSGAPLFNLEGELLGLIRGHLGASDEISFAVPADDLDLALARFGGVEMAERHDEVYRQARAAMARGSWIEAEILLKPLATEGEAEALFLLGHLYRLMGRHHEALELLLRAVEKAPKNVQFFDELGKIYEALGDREAAVRSYRYRDQLQRMNRKTLSDVDPRR